MTNTLMTIENKVWDKMGIEAGSDFFNKDGTKNKKWGLFVWNIGLELEKKNINKVSNKVLDKLEEKNYHSLIEALKELGLTA